MITAVIRSEKRPSLSMQCIQEIVKVKNIFTLKE